ncbi:MAG TPA: P1 family peptidase [Candidatus Angelobacter sp.]|nr:P1 family peptidase [Candidatus Angelobacter sp.]
MNHTRSRLCCLVFLALEVAALAQERPRLRAREIGVRIGVLSTGPLNAITDVPGVLVGQRTVIRGENIRTGVTAIVPHPGNLFREKVPGAVFIGNAFGKLAGSTQVNELGEIETPILLTCTLCVPRAADALIDFMLAVPGNEDVMSINPLVGETNDGYLNDIRQRPISRDDVFAAIRGAKSGPVDEGSVGAGTGTVAFGYKGGIGTASRKLPQSLGGYTVGVLVQTNFGGVLSIAGAPVGKELGRYYLRKETKLEQDKDLADQPVVKDDARRPDDANGSCMIVVATDAPLDARNLKRLASRAIMGLGRTGSSASNGSGDFVIAFSTASELRIVAESSAAARRVFVLGNDAISPLFEAVIESTEEAIINSLFKATTMTGRGHTVEALPLDQTLQVLRRHGMIE